MWNERLQILKYNAAPGSCLFWSSDGQIIEVIQKKSNMPMYDMGIYNFFVLHH